MQSIGFSEYLLFELANYVSLECNVMLFCTQLGIETLTKRKEEALSRMYKKAPYENKALA